MKRTNTSLENSTEEQSKCPKIEFDFNGRIPNKIKTEIFAYMIAAQECGARHKIPLVCKQWNKLFVEEMGKDVLLRDLTESKRKQLFLALLLIFLKQGHLRSFYLPIKSNWILGEDFATEILIRITENGCYAFDLIPYEDESDEAWDEDMTSLKRLFEGKIDVRQMIEYEHDIDSAYPTLRRLYERVNPDLRKFQIFFEKEKIAGFPPVLNNMLRRFGKALLIPTFWYEIPGNQEFIDLVYPILEPLRKEMGLWK